MIDIELFGTTTVRAAGRVLGPGDFGGAKPRHILEILSLQDGRPLAAPALAGMLWDDRPPAAWPATLYSYVGQLRRVLQPGTPGRTGAIRTTSAGYLLDPAAVRIDVQLFDAAADDAARATPEEALPLWLRASDIAARDLLDYEPYLRWAVRARVEVRARVVDAALSGARVALLLGRIDAAVRLARHATAVDPFAEEGWQSLIEGLGLAGRDAEARRAFRLCERSMFELGEQPDAYTRRLAGLPG